jgi:FtsH-binding integral membrane protein
MADNITLGITGGINEASKMVTTIPQNFNLFKPLLIVAGIIALYSVFIWFFYRFLAKKDVLKLNLSKYNEFKHPLLAKISAVFFYVLEFIMIIPLITLVWFSVLSIILILLAKEQPVPQIILISAGIVSAIRVTAYFNEDLSRDLAKMFPFTLLGIVILSPNFFNFDTMMARITEIPLLMDNFFYYFTFIVCLELLLRLVIAPASFLFSASKKRKD